MKKRTLLLFALVSVAGCVDTPDSICREFLNANNENIDALMMVTDERQARNMTFRVFSLMGDRYTALDKKWEIIEVSMGRPNIETIKEFLEADGLHLYRAEYKINAQRFTLEMARIRNLLDQYVTREKEAAKEKGEDPNDVRSDRWPMLHAIINTPSVIGPLRTQLEKPKLEGVLARFNDRVDPATLKIFNEKHERFNKGDPIVLAR